MFTLVVSFLCLMIAAVVHQKAKLMAAATPVPATVLQVWSKRLSRGEPTYFARLIFDRKQNDGEIVHCDVPDVLIGQPAAVGATLTVGPRAETCWEPYIFCENCAMPNDHLALALLIIAVILGFACLFMIITMRNMKSRTV
jgi:hypothetical protein